MSATLSEGRQESQKKSCVKPSRGDGRRFIPLATVYQIGCGYASLQFPNLPILPFDAGAARRYGEIRAQLERQGTMLGDADLCIASIALARDLTIVTGNVRHFQRVPGLSVENWLVY